MLGLHEPFARVICGGGLPQIALLSANCTTWTAFRGPRTSFKEEALRDSSPRPTLLTAGSATPGPTPKCVGTQEAAQWGGVYSIKTASGRYNLGRMEAPLSNLDLLVVCLARSLI